MEKENIIKNIIRVDEAVDSDEFINSVADSKESSKEFIGFKNLWALMQTGNEMDRLTIANELATCKNKIKKTNRVFFIHQWRKIAAVILFILTLSGGYFFGHTKLKNPKDTYTTITCAFGDKTEMVLPDSTKVWLNSGSTLKFNNNFQQKIREVYLDGEAYFSVTKDKKRTFRVKSHEVFVDVLGTEFNLKAYPEEEYISATLITGRINFCSETQQTILNPNQKLVYNKKSKESKVYKLSDSYPEVEWKDGRLVFRNESLETLELKLERWFDVDISFADEDVKKQRFTGILERESILDALYYFKFSKYIDYKIEGNEITFFSTNVNSKNR